MSVVVWDGKTLAADRMAVSGEMKSITCKIDRIDNVIFACTGQAQHFRPLIDWFINGADPAQYPEFQKDPENWSRLIAVIGNSYVIEFENTPYQTRICDPFMAWGSGRDFAMGALAMGADARTAVEIASRYSITCGMGVDAYDVIQGDQPTRFAFGPCGEY